MAFWRRLFSSGPSPKQGPSTEDLRKDSNTCPFCGKLLFSQREKHCPHCLMDWHDPDNPHKFVKKEPVKKEPVPQEVTEKLQELGLTAKPSNEKSILCAVCASHFPVGATSCPKCSSIPLSIQLIQEIYLLIITNYSSQDEAQWWADVGSKTAFAQANPTIFKSILAQPELANSVGFSAGVLRSNDSLDSLQTEWIKKAKSQVHIGQKDSIMVQHGGSITQIPSGENKRAYHVYLLIYRTPNGQDPTVNMVVNTRQIFAI